MNSIINKACGQESITTRRPTEELFADHVGHLQQFVERLCQRFCLDYILIASGSINYHFHDDREYPFKVSPYFKYWLPLIDHPNSYLLLRPGEKPTLLLYQPDDMWLAWPGLDRCDWQAVGAISTLFEISEIKQINEIVGLYPLLAKQSTKGVFIGPTDCLHNDWLIDRINDSEVLSFIHYHRSYKTPYEVQCLYQANIRSVPGHKKAHALFKSGATEAQILWGFLQANGIIQQDRPYDPMIAQNENAGILHYQHKSMELPVTGLRSLLIDAANDYVGYAADITRTYSYREDDFATLIGDFDILQRELVGQIKVGMTQAELHDQACQRIARFMHDHHFITCSAEQADKERLVEYFFPHGLGHMLGLQVHDVGGHLLDESGTQAAQGPRYPKQRNRTIDSGMVFTVEPGFYFIKRNLEILSHSRHAQLINWATVKEFEPYGGIRIEDDICMTDKGPINLTRLAMEG